jgi:riboflavin biosynthesis pyrimidine reductase
MRMVYRRNHVSPAVVDIINPSDLEMIDHDSDEYVRAAAAVDGLYPWPVTESWVRANMVSTLDGRSQGPDGLTASISSAADKFVFARLRATCDVILVGAGTARAENYRPARTRASDTAVRTERGQRTAPIIAVVSQSLRLDPEADLFAAPQHDPSIERPFVITTEDSDPGRRQLMSEVATVLVAGATQVDIAEALTQLAGHDLRRVLCEGGPTLLSDLISSGNLCELDLTLSPQLVGSGLSMVETGTNAALPNAPIAQVGQSFDLSHVIEADSMLLLRYVKPNIDFEHHG